MTSGKALLGVVAGIAAGVALGMIFAPDRGETTRRNISKKGEDLANALNEKMEESNTTMNNKNAKDRTKEEVDAFNKLVTEVNKEVGNYNKLNAKFNAEKTTAVNNWNMASENFVSKHVPKD